MISDFDFLVGLEHLVIFKNHFCDHTQGNILSLSLSLFLSIINNCRSCIYKTDQPLYAKMCLGTFLGHLI